VEVSGGLGITPHRARFARFVRVAGIDGWRIKLYGIATHREDARPALLDATQRLADAMLPRPAVGEGHYGVGFAIAHDASAASIGIIYWWQSSNELHQRVHVGPLDQPDRMAPIADQAAGCVWELAVVEFERQAWLADVLANPGGPDLDAYMSRRFDGDI
jgi:hypothetical protein